MIEGFSQVELRLLYQHTSYDALVDPGSIKVIMD